MNAVLDEHCFWRLLFIIRMSRIIDSKLQKTFVVPVRQCWAGPRWKRSSWPWRSWPRFSYAGHPIMLWHFGEFVANFCGSSCTHVFEVLWALFGTGTGSPQSRPWRWTREYKRASFYSHAQTHVSIRSCTAISILGGKAGLCGRPGWDHKHCRGRRMWI